MLALRSTLVIDALDEPRLRAAVRSAADAVTIDLASEAAHEDRGRARALAARHAGAIAGAGQPVFVRVSDARSGELEADLDAVVTAGIAALILSGAEAPQDVRDIDVAARKREMRGGLEPGGIRLIAEIDSAAGLLALPRIIEAVDRHDAVALNTEAIRAEFGASLGGAAMLDHAMGAIAIAAHAARLPWILMGREELATRAHDFGAAGVRVGGESAVLGMNALFDLDPVAVADARAILVEWGRMRRSKAMVGIVAGERGEQLVDRRSVRAARALVERADAIEARVRQ